MALTKILTGDVLARSGRAVVAVPSAVVAGITAPARARRHPKSSEVRALRRDGWELRDIALSVNPGRAAVRLERHGSVHVVADNDPAFVAYAAALRAVLPEASR